MSRKPIAILGQTGNFTGSWSLPARELFALTGLNTGNTAFWAAVSRHVANEKIFVPWDFDVEYVNTNCSALLMPAANMINSHQDHKFLGQRFARLRVPSAIVGIGIQMATTDTIDTIKLQPGTVEFLESIQTSGTVVGCRGKTTKELLDRYSIDSRVIGCPSNFLNPSRDFANAIGFDDLDLRRGLFINIDFNKRLKDVNAKMFAFRNQFGGIINIQDPLEGVQYALRDREKFGNEEFISHVCKVFDFSSDDYFSNSDHTVAIFDANMWSVMARSYALSFGTRFHGNMISFQSGVPTIFVPHDARTEELAESIGVPVVGLESFTSADKLSDIIAGVRFEPASYLSKRSVLAQAYAEVLETIGVEVAPPWSELVSTHKRSS